MRSKYKQLIARNRSNRYTMSIGFCCCLSGLVLLSSEHCSNSHKAPPHSGLLPAKPKPKPEQKEQNKENIGPQNKPSGNNHMPLANHKATNESTPKDETTKEGFFGQAITKVKQRFKGYQERKEIEAGNKQEQKQNDLETLQPLFIKGVEDVARWDKSKKNKNKNEDIQIARTFIIVAKAFHTSEPMQSTKANRWLNNIANISTVADRANDAYGNLNQHITINIQYGSDNKDKDTKKHVCESEKAFLDFIKEAKKVIADLKTLLPEEFLKTCSTIIDNTGMSIDQAEKSWSQYLGSIKHNDNVIKNAYKEFKTKDIAAQNKVVTLFQYIAKLDLDF